MSEGAKDRGGYKNENSRLVRVKIFVGDFKRVVKGDSTTLGNILLHISIE